MAVPLGIVLVWLGYAAGYYGYSRLKGGNNSFVSLVWPGRYNYVAPDGPAPQNFAAGTTQYGAQATPGKSTALTPSPQPGSYAAGGGGGTLVNPTNPEGAV